MKLLPFIFSLIICFAAAAIGSFFTYPSIGSWYSQLNKPFFTPPNWLFGPAWTILYFTMAVALSWIWKMKVGRKRKEEALTFFFVQLGLNILWSVLFFGLKSPELGFICIVVLWWAIYMTIKKFMKITEPAGLILIPYLLWVSFASLLNLGVVLLN